MHTLLSQTKDLVKKEKHFTYLILANLKKIEESKLYCDLGYSSLYAYLEKELGYSSAESALRVANIKLMKASPLAEEKIKAGQINLTQGGSLFQAIGKSDVEDKPAKMEEALSLIDGKSTRESEKIINEIFKMEGKIQKKIILNDRLKEKLERIKKIYGEKSFEEIIEILVDDKLMENKLNLTKGKLAVENEENSLFSNTVKPAVKDEKNYVLSNKAKPAIKDEKNYVFSNKEMSVAKNEERPAFRDTEKHDKRNIEQSIDVYVKKPDIKNVENPTSRYIPVSLKRAVFIRAQKCCEYVSANGMRCTERRNLEFEHVIPYSQKGGHTLENLKLYCRSHNQRQGILKIDNFLEIRKEKTGSANRK